MTVLVVTATAAEAAALAAGLHDAGHEPQGGGTRVGPYRAVRAGDCLVVTGGVGPAAAAAVTATALATVTGVSLVVCAGIAGGFAGRARTGDVVVATEVVAADLGVGADEGWLDAGRLGLSEVRTVCPPELVDEAARRVRAAGRSCVTGPVLTLSAMTGTDARAAELADRHGAAAEAMEGAGVASAATAWGLALLELRTVSNAVGRRDRSAWRVPEALAALRDAAAAVLSRPLPAG